MNCMILWEMVVKEIFNINPKAVEVENFNIEDGIKFFLLPGKIEDKEYFFTTKEYLIDALNFYNKQDVKFDVVITDTESFNRLLSQFMEVKTKEDLEDSSLEEIEEELSLDDFLKNGVDIQSVENSAPIIKFVNSMFFQAIKKRASDIHIETQESFGVVRFRIDGVLITQTKLPKNVVSLIINRIKVI